MQSVTGQRRVPFVLVIAGVLLTVGAFIPVGAIRALITLPMTLILPGAALLFALDAFRGRWDIAPILALSVMVSLAFYPLAGLLIYKMGLSLSPFSVASEVDVFTLAMLAVGLLRRVSPGHRPAPLLGVVSTDQRDMRRWGAWLGVVTVACAAVLAWGVLVLPQAAPPPYTAFYFAGSAADATLKGSATVAANTPLATQVAIENRSNAPVNYVVRTTVDGATTAGREISVSASATWKGSVVTMINQPGCLQQLVIDLLHGDGSSKIASLDLWIHVMGAGCPS
jgi:uncharacterized membrane protein